MSLDIQKEIELIQKDYAEKLAKIQQNSEWHLIPALNEELQKSLMEVTSKFSQTSTVLSMNKKSEHYRHVDCSVDLDEYVYDGDKIHFENFYNMPMVKGFLEGPQRPPMFNAKKELLKTALRLSKGMAPKVFNAIDRCREKLGLTAKIDIYCSQNPSMNAFCYPSHADCIYICVTSSLLEKFNEDELTFVIGHEIGHYLYQHHLLNPNLILSFLGHEFSPADQIRLYSWHRNAEISADRVGLICCGSYEAACTANFKLSSGISSDILSFNIDEYVEQYKDVEHELKTGEGSPEDFYSTHPISPMRVMALDIFFRSETYCKTFATSASFHFSEKEMEEKISGFMSLLEPTYLQNSDDSSKVIKEFIFLGGIAVASADSNITEEELKTLWQILPDQNQEAYEKIKTWDLDTMKAALTEQAERVFPHLTYAMSMNIIRDLTLISLADGTLSDPEMDVLAGICILLRLHPSFIDQVLNSIQCQQAA